MNLEHSINEDNRKHILVIDDDPLMLKLIKEHLHDKYIVAAAVSGKIAYKFLENKDTDMILLDYEMPVENGAVVLSKLRQIPKLSDTPILFLTGTADTSLMDELISLGSQGYISKPINKDILLENIQKYIG